MARILSRAQSYRYWREAFGIASDKQMSVRTMNAYLQYRLYQVDAKIEVLLGKLGMGKGVASGYCPGCEHLLSDEFRASWTSLNYLLNSREALRKTLTREEQDIP